MLNYHYLLEDLIESSVRILGDQEIRRKRMFNVILTIFFELCQVPVAVSTA